MKRRLCRIRRNIEVTALDSEKEVDRENRWLPSRILSMAQDSLLNLVEKVSDKGNRLGR